jgi:hypothetical protein
MKKFFFVTLLSVAALTTFAQHRPSPKLNLYSAYVFDDSYSSYYDPYSYYEGKIKGGYQWGVGLEFPLHEQYALEVLYLRQDTHAPTTYKDPSFGAGTKNTNFGVGLNYIMVGGMRSVKKDKIEGYGGLMLGMAIVDVKNPDNGNSNSATKFAWGLRLGCNIWASERIALKLQTQLLSIVQQAGGGLYFGTGGVGAGVSTYSTVYQFGLGGGLVFKLGK